MTLGRRRVVVASGWTVFGFGARQVIRLGSNLILTRLLFPEAFALMALVTVFLEAIQMFSDLGVRASVIRSASGDHPEYLSTAWTLQIIRGVGLWIVALVGAIPFAMFYGEPLLAWMIPVAGLKAVLLGLRSSKTLTCERAVALGRITGLELAGYIASVIVMIAWAWAFRSVWALLVGALVGTLIVVVGGYFVLPGRNARFGLNREAMSDILGFGKWIFVSTALTFLLRQGESLVLAKYMPLGVFGVYAIAILWARTPMQIGELLSTRVFFPALSRVRDRSIRHLRSRIVQVRVAYMGLLLPPLLVLAVLGDQVIWILLDDRYAAAGWIIRVLASGFAAAVIGASTGNALLVQGDSLRYMLLQITKGGLLVGGLFAGALVGARNDQALAGMILGASAARWLEYPVLAWGLHRNGVWLPWLDAAAYTACAIVIGLGWWFLPLEPDLLSATTP